MNLIGSDAFYLYKLLEKSYAHHSYILYGPFGIFYTQGFFTANFSLRRCLHLIKVKQFFKAKKQF